MDREISMEEISDGRFYEHNDLVKVGCNDCQGCSVCCRGMGSSIVLDPYDIWRLTGQLGRSFEALLAESLELNVVDGVVLPNLRMAGREEACVYLNEQGRCSIHTVRPGICRLFPMGRFYENRTFRYFLQVHECAKENKTKIKLKKWLDTPELKRYEQFIADWHYLLRDLQEKMQEAARRLPEEAADALSKKCNLYILQQFFMVPYEAADFYGQYEERRKNAAAFFASLWEVLL